MNSEVQKKKPEGFLFNFLLLVVKKFSFERILLDLWILKQVFSAILDDVKLQY